MSPGKTSKGAVVVQATTTDAVRTVMVEHMTLMATMRSQNAREGWVWSSHEGLLLSMAGDPVAVGSLSIPDGVKVGAVKECFYNAFMLSTTNPNFLYTEGFAYSGFFPVAHAWVTDTSTGAIIDPTWVNLKHRGPFGYLGLRFSHDFMRTLLETADVPTVFESDYARRMRTLRCGLILNRDRVVVDWGDPPPF